MGEIYLIRHGQTEWNKEKRYRGVFDVPLNESGRREAECAADALRNVPLARVYSSPLSRAVQTAQIIIGSRAIGIRSDGAFVDIDYGRWTKLPDEQVQKDYPELHAQWRQAPHSVQFPDGGSLAEVRRRVVSRLQYLTQVFAGSSIAIVSHRVPLKLILAAVKGLDNSRFWKITIDTGAIALIRTESAVLRLIHENDTRHLKRLNEHDSVDF